MPRDLFFRLVGTVLFAVTGWQLGIVFGVEGEFLWVVVPTLLGAGLGFLLSPYLISHPLRWAVRRIRQAPAHILVAGTVALVIALILAALLAVPLSKLPGVFGSVLPILATLVLIYVAIAIMVAREGELLQVFASYFRGRGPSKSAPQDGQVILDTSAIIDGRIADISQTGFVHGTLLIPRFVLDELRHVADSPDPLRRNRGRRGLEMLSKLQKESNVPVQISEAEIENIPEVDGKLVQLAKTLRCPIVTNDFNLNRIAELQGVRVLNINELANAVKPVVLPGEEMSVRVIQDGKEVGQGVAFLDDGTMVVVEGGRRYLNSEVNIVVTRVLQTAAGRMIFAHPKQE